MTPTMTHPEAHTIAMLRMHFKCSYSKIGILAKAIWSENDLAAMCGVAYLGSDLGRALVNTMEGIMFINRGESDTMHMNEVACPECNGTQISIYPEDCPKLECIHCRAMIPALNVMIRDILEKPSTDRLEAQQKPCAIPPPAPEQFTFMVRTGQGPIDVTADEVDENAEYVRFRLAGKPVACFSRPLFRSYLRIQRVPADVSDDRKPQPQPVPVTGSEPPSVSELRCGTCMLPIAKGETGLRHFGTSTSHSHDRCVALLRTRLENASGMADVIISKCESWPEQFKLSVADIDRLKLVRDWQK